jgi:hypothetical protein
MQYLNTLIDCNLSHPHYGRLLQHCDLQNHNILHYSIQINDSDSLAWEPIQSGKGRDTGRLAVWVIDWQRFRPDQTQHQDRASIDRALHISLREFDRNWQYDLYRFNCEHWARLVSTGDCRCYQIAEMKKFQRIPILGSLIVGMAGTITGAWEHNGYAQGVIESNDCTQREQ